MDFEAMNKKTVQSAHDRIDALEKQIIEIKTEMKIQFKDLYNRMKRMEAIMIGITGASLLLLIRMTIMG
jgi:uncharacterized iron-regulated protein